MPEQKATGAGDSSSQALPGLSQALEHWVSSVRAQLGATSELAANEARLAAVAAMVVLASGLTMGGMMVVAWAGLITAVAGLMFDVAEPLILTAGSVALSSLGGFFIAYWVARHYSRHLRFSATRKALFESSSHGSADQSPSDCETTAPRMCER